MSETTLRLNLPMIAAAQAQKHVTHNEALFALDAILHLHVESKGLSAPPGSPPAGARYIVGSAPTGAWAGQAGRVAAWDDGAWRFVTPRRGWMASVGAGAVVELFDGAAWRPAFEPGAQQFTALGVNATPDAANPVAMRLNNILVMARALAEGGDGDIRLKLSKQASANTASVLFQTAAAGRAEFGLTGSDAFALKVSADGAAWRDALRIDQTTGEAVFPGGLAAGHRSPNLLINGDFAIRQRGGPLGAIPANAFAFDRWRAGAGGASVSQSSQAVTLASGSLQQVVEPRLFGFESFSGQRLTLSAQHLSGADLSITIAGVGAQIVRASAPFAVTVLVPAGATGPIVVSIAPSGGVATFRQVRLEPGDVATGWRLRSLQEEMSLCRRYFRKSYPSQSAPGAVLGGAGGGAIGTVSTSTGLYFVNATFPSPMRAAPVVTLFNPVTGAPGSWRTGSGSLTVPTIDVHDAGVAFVGAGVEPGAQVFGHFTADAEL